MKDKIEKINESRIVKHISGRWLIQINDSEDDQYGDSEFEYLDEWIQSARNDVATLGLSREELLELRECLIGAERVSNKQAMTNPIFVRWIAKLDKLINNYEGKNK